MKNLVTTLMLAFVSSLLFSQEAQFVMVDPENNQVTIKNFSSSTVDISSYYLCSNLTYASLSSGLVTINEGDLNLSQNEEVTLTWNSGGAMTLPEADLGLYLNSFFANSGSILDFLQWGAGGQARENVANSAGIWISGEFVDLEGPFFYTGDGFQNGPEFWGSHCGAGEISTSSGEVSYEFCSNETISPIELENNGTGLEDLYDYFVTDNNGLIVEPLGGSTADFSSTDPGTYHIYGVSYTGTLSGSTNDPGDPIDGLQTSSGCLEITSNFVEVVIFDVPNMMISANGDLDLCPGENVGLMAIAGFETYDWSNGESSQSITVNESGTYSVIGITDDGCTDSSGELVVTVLSEDHPDCTDCPDLGANIGDECDDGNASTVDDTVTEDCTCEGTPMSGCPADLDENEVVGTSDLLILLGEFGCEVECAADINEDEVVGTSDLLILIGAFGTICNGG